MTAFTVAALKTEINTDPKALGYAALRARTDAPDALAARINEAGSVPTDTLFKSYTPIEDLLAEMQWAEFTTWSAAVKAGVDQYLRGSRAKTGSATLRASFATMIPAGVSKTAMIALASRPASRAEILWGEFFSVSAQDVGAALELP